LTVCVASFAEESKAIVCIADRAVTYPSYGSPVQSDSGMKKIIDVGDTKWCALFAGDTSLPQQVVARLATKAVGATRDFAWMACTAATTYQECYEEQIENQVLRPNLLTRATFISRPRNLQPLDPQIITSVNNKMQQFELSCQLMFCGFDGTSPHIFTVVEPGVLQWNDLEGHNAIGIGKEAATSRIAWLETESSESLPSVFYDVFDAKVASEIIQGVGYEWDGRVLIAGKAPIEVPKKIKRLIDQIWMCNNRSPYADPLDDEDIAPRTWRSQMQKFRDDCFAMPPTASPPVPP